MAVRGWLLDKSAAVRATDPVIGPQLMELAGKLCICPTALLEQLFSARSAREYDEKADTLRGDLRVVDAPADILERGWSCSGISPTTTGCGTRCRSPTC